ncbi:hypothetical protein G5I_09208 [Acromyrmex echinatior]|uniref:Uncharacterized protein n=1 Tax=Acromyrmex echinatior TaxID=103372 RepID=F4WTK3_ACREC|nr:hypothetical protein G5I_09208 [Acromyrmex echinatior]
MVFLEGGDRRREERFTAAMVRANQTRRGALPAQIFHSYGQINHDLSAGCTAVWGIERINDAMFGIEHAIINNNSGKAISSKCRLIFVKGERGLKSIRHKIARANTGLERGEYSEGGKATWIPEGGINPPSLSLMLTHLDNGDEAIIFSAPEARYVSMRIRLSDLM